MTATVEIWEANGGTDGSPGTKTRMDGQLLNSASDVRFCTTATHDPGATYPCVIPSSGNNYSYWKHLYLNITGSFTTLNNINFYTDESIGWNCGTGGGLYVGKRDSGDNGAPMDASYELSTGTEGTTGNTISTDHARYSTGGSVVTAATYSSATPLLIDSTDYSSTDESNATVLQVFIHDDSTQGTAATETISWAYDEI